MGEPAVHARLHELYMRLHPETGDDAMTWREAVRELLDTIGARRGPDDPDEDPDVRAEGTAPRAGARSTGPGEDVQDGAGLDGAPAGADVAARPGQPPAT